MNHELRIVVKFKNYDFIFPIIHNSLFIILVYSTQKPSGILDPRADKMQQNSGNGNGREHAHQNTDGQSDGKTLNDAGAKPHKDKTGN